MLWCLLAAALAGPPAQRPEVFVSAAASLTDVLKPLAAAFEARTGRKVILNLGASNVLARQIAAGARVDLFISADEAQLNVVAAQIVPGSRVNLLSNQLAIAVPDDRPRPIGSARDLLREEFARIAIGDPAAVPAGVYARQYLERLGLWAGIAPKVIPAGSVRLALAAVENGAADAAIVYRTDIGVARRAREAFVVPLAEGPRIVYPAAVLTGGAGTDGAHELLRFLRGPEAARAFERAGFVVLR